MDTPDFAAEVVVVPKGSVSPLSTLTNNLNYLP
jgi:hypothetical protein